MVLEPVISKKAGGTDYSGYPVGSVILSASGDVGPEWLRCDGSYINESTYPELTAFLGKKTPGVREAFKAGEVIYNGTFSSSYLYNGYLWVYCLQESLLLGFPLSGDPVLELPVTGSSGFLENPEIPVVLSICGGRAFLAQKTESRRMLLFTGAFSIAAASIAMTAVEVDGVLSAGITGTEAIVNGWPEVVAVQDYPLDGVPQDCFAVCVGESDTSNSYIYYLVMPQAGVDSAVLEQVQQTQSSLSSGMYMYKLSRSLKAFSRKCLGELFYIYANFLSTGLPSFAKAYPQSVWKGSYDQANSEASRQVSEEQSQIVSVPLATSLYYIYNVELADGKVVLRAGMAGSNTFTLFPDGGQAVNGITLSPYASLFPDSLEYISSHGLYVIFVGTGILFSHTPLDMDSWGYLDTTDYFGTITQWGAAEFDVGTNTLCLSGRDTYGDYVCGFLRLHEHFDYANDGAWLPYIASSGVPAWIKALPTEDA